MDILIRVSDGFGKELIEAAAGERLTTSEFIPFAIKSWIRIQRWVDGMEQEGAVAA